MSWGYRLGLYSFTGTSVVVHSSRMQWLMSVLVVDISGCSFFQLDSHCSFSSRYSGFLWTSVDVHFSWGSLLMSIFHVEFYGCLFFTWSSLDFYFLVVSGQVHFLGGHPLLLILDRNFCQAPKGSTLEIIF